MPKTPTVTLDLSDLFSDQAKVDDLPQYINHAVQQAGKGNQVILTGGAPIWLYLSIAHALHGKVNSLVYQSPGLVHAESNPEGKLLIFSHNAY